MELWRLLAHNHWFTLNILGRKLRLCARCSGYVLGFSLPPLILKGMNIQPNLVGEEYLLICFLLAFPLIFDWVTQSFGLRNSNNAVRVFTGILLGIDLFIYTLLDINMGVKKAIFVAITLIIFIVGNIGTFRIKAQ